MAAGKDTGKDMAQGLGGKVGAQLQGAADELEDDDAEELRIAQQQYEAAQRKIIEKREAKAKEAQRLLEEAAARVAGFAIAQAQASGLRGRALKDALIEQAHEDPKMLRLVKKGKVLRLSP